jgi:regulator of replication initiation timing
MSLNQLMQLDLDKLDFSNQKSIQVIVSHLLNLLESLYKENVTLKQENQKLKDEINRLKGEKGKPKFKPKTTVPKDTGAKQQQKKKKGQKQTKVDKITIDDTEVIKYEGPLPADAEHKGYRDVPTQGITVKTNNILYRLERYYSASEGKVYEACLPDHINGGYDASIPSWILFWYFHSRMSEQKIHQMLTDIGIQISAGHISNIIIKDNDDFHQEKSDIIKAGLESTDYQHIDDTGARVNGTNQYFSVLCNDYYSAFFTNPQKDRLTIIDILSQIEEIPCLLNQYAIAFLNDRNLKSSLLKSLKGLSHKDAMPLEAFTKQLELLLPELKPKQKKLILEAALIAGYQESNSSSQIQRLVCDDAKQFWYITLLRALCWIHEERHYTKLNPLFSYHQKLVDDFRARIWAYYAELKKYKQNPNQEEKIRLSELFDEIFSTETGYDELDERIRLTKAKKENLLVVLDYPDTPLHNNPAELALRMYVIKRKISFGTRTEEGTKSWETFFTILDTCRKLGVNFRDYLYDRISKQYKMPSLATLIIKAAT